MTTVYFIRHAEPNFANHDDAARELSEKGRQDRFLLCTFFQNQKLDGILSSPYRRAVDTVTPLAQERGLEVQTEERFRERKVGDSWIEDFDGFSRRQWADFDYRCPGGESLLEVQQRNLEALREALANYQGKTIVIGSHGTALSTIVNYYQPSFGYPDFQRIKDIMPWIVKFTFEKEECIRIEEIDIFHQ